MLVDRGRDIKRVQNRRHIDEQRRVREVSPGTDPCWIKHYVRRCRQGCLLTFAQIHTRLHLDRPYPSHLVLEGCLLPASLLSLGSARG